MNWLPTQTTTHVHPGKGQPFGAKNSGIIIVIPLRYGNGISCELDSDRITHLQAIRVETLSDKEIIAQTRAALANPIDYPSLSDATVPEDRAVIAISQGVPHPLAMLEGALRGLCDAGVESSLTSILLPRAFAQETELLNLLERSGASEIQILRHNPDDDDSIAMLGVTRDGQPVRLNRYLCDADVVLTIGSASADSWSSFNGLYPGFSDSATINRLAASRLDDEPSARERCRDEIVESGWLLGVGMIVQAVPGPGGNVTSILVGEASKIFLEGEKQYRALWESRCSQSADLVIASLVGNSDQHTWENLGRALNAASAVLGEGGAIAICSELEDLPGKAFQAFADSEDYDVIEREISRDQLNDNWAARVVCRALQRGPVYLSSRLPAAVVESLGMTPIVMEQELERLIESHNPIIVLEEAQRLLPSLSVE
jgi:nickel-dependent lactate racemase